MTTDLAVRDAEQYAITPTPTVRALADYAVELDAAMRLAEALARTNFVPDCFRGKPAEAAAAILTGHELGFPPTAALRAFYPAPGGRMEMYARAMQAVAISHGHKLWVASQSDEKVVVKGHQKGMPADVIYEVTWDPDRVRKAGLIKEKGNHEKFGQQMMAARGIAEMARLVAPAELFGMYAPEERDEYITVEASVGEAEAPALTAADILATAVPAAQEQSAVPEPERVEVKPSDADLRRLWGRMKPHGLHSADLALEWMTQTTGRRVDSREELTRADLVVLGAALDKLDANASGGESA